jgi:hypothetical protein
MNILTFNLPEDIRAILKADRAVEVDTDSWVLLGRDGSRVWPHNVESETEYGAIVAVKTKIENKLADLAIQEEA